MRSFQLCMITTLLVVYMDILGLITKPLHCFEVCRSWILRTQKLKTHQLRTQSSKVLPIRPGVGQNIAMHATPSARDFFLELISTLLDLSLIHI